ncbi:ANTAR domain-containing protein [Alkalimonas sp. NCh-2]|uniref:ANTAR domain-containing response regulator n=1 Tax=Alkalimonas sp. NCh-2 TaxID=3144846 RepID=UPI0031F6CBFF
MERAELSVMLVDDETERAQLLEQALQQHGYQVICRLTSTAALRHHVERLQPDMIIIDMDSPDRDTLEHMAVISQHNPKPIVFFAEQDQDPDNIRLAIQAGVSAYIVDGLTPKRVKPILDVAIARFHEFQQLRQQLASSQTALAEQQLLEKAKRLLIKHRGCTEAEAFQTLRKLAMDRQQKMTEVARDLISLMEVL